MKQKSVSQNQRPPGPARSAAAAEANRSGIVILPSTDDFSQWAYFSDVNDGSLPGREAQDWLEAEAQWHAKIPTEVDSLQVNKIQNRT